MDALPFGEWIGSSLGFIEAMLSAMVAATGLVLFVLSAAKSYDAVAEPQPAPAPLPVPVSSGWEVARRPEPAFDHARAAEG